MQLLSRAFLDIVALAAAASFLGALAVGRRRPRRLVVSGAVTAALVGVVYVWIRSVDLFHSGFPWSFCLWAATPIGALVLLASGWRSSTWRQRLVGAVAVPTCLVFASATVNAHYAYFPDLASLRGKVAAHKVSAAAVHRAVVKAEATGKVPSSGLVFSSMIPGTRSGFHARGAVVYVPPAWFASPRPTLPAVMLIAGSPGTPADWTRSGQIDEIADRWALAHAGVAPILVMPDANGAPLADTECVDGPRGNAETYLTQDVHTFVIDHYGAASDASRWAIGGLSEGGTCALVLAIRHPDLFATFADFGGYGSLSDGRRTLDSLFGGSVTTMIEHQPAHLLGRRYLPSLAGWFETGTHDRTPRAAAEQFSTSITADGGTACVVVRAGLHNFVFWHDAFEHALPWLVGRLGLGAPDENACVAAGGHWATKTPKLPAAPRSTVRRTPARPTTTTRPPAR